MELFDYKVKQLIQKKIEEQREALVTQNIQSFDEYKYQLGQLHALERFMLDYQDLYKKAVNDE